MRSNTSGRIRPARAARPLPGSVARCHHEAGITELPSSVRRQLRLLGDESIEFAGLCHGWSMASLVAKRRIGKSEAAAPVSKRLGVGRDLMAPRPNSRGARSRAGSLRTLSRPQA